MKLLLQLAASRHRPTSSEWRPAVAPSFLLVLPSLPGHKAALLTASHTPSTCRQRLARRLVECSPAAETQALAAALAAATQQRAEAACSLDSSSADCLACCSDDMGSSSSAASEDAVWTLGSCAHAGDVWCLLQLALHCSTQAAAAASPKRRHRLYMQALRLMRQAAAEVHAAAPDWDVFLRGGASAALGSFVALCSSGAGGAAEAARQLDRVAQIVTDAAAEEGGIELWALQVRCAVHVGATVVGGEEEGEEERSAIVQLAGLFDCEQRAWTQCVRTCFQSAARRRTAHIPAPVGCPQDLLQRQQDRLAAARAMGS